MATSRFSLKSIECEVSKTLCFARIHAYHCGQSCSWVSWLKCVIIDKTEWHEVLWVLLRTSRSQRQFGVVDLRLEYVTPFPLAVKTHTFPFRIPENEGEHASRRGTCQKLGRQRLAPGLKSSEGPQTTNTALPWLVNPPFMSPFYPETEFVGLSWAVIQPLWSWSICSSLEVRFDVMNISWIYHEYIMNISWIYIMNIYHEFISWIYIMNIYHEYIFIYHEYISWIYIMNIYHEYISWIYIMNIYHEYIIIYIYTWISVSHW